MLQFNDAADVWSANGTGLFIVWNQTNGFSDALIPGLDNQTLIIKYSRLLNVLS